MSDPEARRGARPYLEILADLHRMLAPRGYVEIGVRAGHSLALATCPALGIDPAPALRLPLPDTTRVLTMTSDAWAASNPVLSWPLDLAFIDGLHTADQVARDFIALERLAHPGTVIVLDDIYPNHPEQARRERVTKTWTGDVWLFLEALHAVRDDLTLISLDSSPTGLLLVAGFNQDVDKKLVGRRELALQEMCRQEKTTVPEHVLKRHYALDPDPALIGKIADAIRRQRP